jgi:chaperonin cofactor prefoldin
VNGTTSAIAALAGTILVQIASAAYWAGKVTKALQDLEQRVQRLEVKVEQLNKEVKDEGYRRRSRSPGP